MSKSDTTGKRQDARFKPGQSGSPNGRPKECLNATTLAVAGAARRRGRVPHEEQARRSPHIADGVRLSENLLVICPKTWEEGGSVGYIARVDGVHRFG
jgi:hypothetical protein